MGAEPSETEDRPRWWVPVLAVLGWIVLWYFTPGLHRNGLGSFLAGEVASTLVETGAALAIVVVIVMMHRDRTRELLARNWQVWLYSLPLAAALALPLHYTLPLPVAVYMVWMTVSVFWQDYLTFGLLQSYLRDHLPTAATIGVVAAVFTLGHMIMIPGRFAPPHLLPALGILAMGVAFASIRARAGTLHILLALHLGFYLVAA